MIKICLTDAKGYVLREMRISARSLGFTEEQLRTMLPTQSMELQHGTMPQWICGVEVFHVDDAPEDSRHEPVVLVQLLDAHRSLRGQVTLDGDTLGMADHEVWTCLPPQQVELAHGLDSRQAWSVNVVHVVRDS